MPMAAAGGEQVRLFFAVPLANELRDRACELQGELAAAGARVKWVERPNLHMTLKFVGEVPGERVEAYCEEAAQVAAGAKGCEIAVRGVGCFQSRGAPRTIWLGTEGEAPELAELAAGLDEALARAGLGEAERRAFAAHFTLGRVRGRQRAGELLAAIERLADAVVGQMPVESFVLMRSELTPSGPIYTEQARFDLSTAS
jgi:2'-5' RNA ligase